MIDPAFSRSAVSEEVVVSKMETTTPHGAIERWVTDKFVQFATKGVGADVRRRGRPAPRHLGAYIAPQVRIEYRELRRNDYPLPNDDCGSVIFDF